MNNVIYLKDFAYKKALKKFEDTGQLSDILLQEKSMITKHGSSEIKRSIEKSVAQNKQIVRYLESEKFILEYDHYMDTLNTKSAEFMFPSILCNYRKGINPVKALYNSLQESILKYDRENTHYNWILSLFEDSAWYDNLMLALRTDISNGKEILKSGMNNESILIKDDKKNLARTLEDFLTYVEIFEMLKDWKKDNIDL